MREVEQTLQRPMRIRRDGPAPQRDDRERLLRMLSEQEIELMRRQDPTFTPPKQRAPRPLYGD